MTQPDLAHALHQLDLVLAPPATALSAAALLHEIEQIDAAVQRAAGFLERNPWGLARLLPSLTEMARQRQRSWKQWAAVGAEQPVSWLGGLPACPGAQPARVANETGATEPADAPEELPQDAITVDLGPLSVAHPEAATTDACEVVASVENEVVEVVTSAVCEVAASAAEPAGHEAGPVWSSVAPIASTEAIQSFLGGFRKRKAVVATIMRTGTPLPSIREAVVREVLDTLGPVPAQLKGASQVQLLERLELVSSDGWLRRWNELDGALQVDLLGLLSALTRAVEECSPLQPRSKRVFARLSAHSQREQPGFTHGLARKHAPQRGSWLDDARQAEKTLRRWLGDRIEDTPVRLTPAPGAEVAPRSEEASAADLATKDEEPELLLGTDWLWWPQVRGKRVVLVGGSPREPSRLRLQKAFAFTSLDWVDGQVRRIEKLARKVAHRSLDLVLIVTQFVGHDASDKIIDACKRGNVPFATIDSGPSVLSVRRAIQRFVPCPGSQG